MTCMICQKNAASFKCFECQTPICEDCATFYIVEVGCCTELLPVYLCPACLKEYSADYY